MARNDHLNHKPNDIGVIAIEAIRSAIINLDQVLQDYVPEGRERSLAMTKLEECRMWAVKGAVINNSACVDPVPSAA